MTLQELQAQYQIDPEIIRIWTERESETLLPIQEAAIREHGILEGQDLLVSAPTSSGKTFLAEIVAIHAIFHQKKVIYLTPLKALAEEKYTDFSEKYSEFGLDVVISTGDRTEFDHAIERGDFHLAVLVFEKAHRLLARNKYFLDHCGLIVIDEIQMTADYSRGSTLEMLLTAILYLRGKLPAGRTTNMTAMQLIALSAVLNELNHLEEWLGMKVLVSGQRPVELHEGILRKDGVLTYRSFIAQEIGTEQFPPFPAHKTFNLKSAEGRREYEYQRLLHYVSALLERGEQILVFRKWKWLTRETALRLARDLQLPPALQALEAVHEMEDSISKEILIEALRHGTAFHNADLDRHERQVIERFFRAEQSKIRIVCATSTLAMGMNLPVNTVIINDLEKPDPYSGIFQEIPISTADYKNMSGRAGRLKQRDLGRSILFADTPAEEGILWRNYIEGEFPRLYSRLVESSLVQETLFLLAAGICASEQDVCTFMQRSYAGTLHWQNSAEAFEMAAEKIRPAIQLCLAHELLTITETNRLQVTEIGRVCAIQGVAVETFIRIMGFLEKIDLAVCDPWELLFIAQHNRELDDVHVRLSQAAYEAGEYWRALRELAPPNYEPLIKHSEQLLQNRFEVTKRIKMSLLLLDWISGMSLQRLELKYSQFYRDKSYSGVIRSLAENAGWMLRLVTEIATVRHAEETTLHRLRTLSQRVLFGVNEYGIELAALYVPGLTRTMVMHLADAGYTREEQILDAEFEELLRILPRDIAFRLQDRLYKKYSRAEMRHLVDQKLRLERLGYDTTLLKQIYAAATLTEFDKALKQLFRTPQIKLILQDIVTTDQTALEKGEYGRDYLIERENGTVLLRILPPQLRELQDDQFGHLFTIGIKYAPQGFLLIGRPDFSEATYAAARQFSQTYSKSLELYPAYSVCERYVQALEQQGTFELGMNI